MSETAIRECVSFYIPNFVYHIIKTTKRSMIMNKTGEGKLETDVGIHESYGESG